MRLIYIIGRVNYYKAQAAWFDGDWKQKMCARVMWPDPANTRTIFVGVNLNSAMTNYGMLASR